MEPGWDTRVNRQAGASFFRASRFGRVAPRVGEDPSPFLLDYSYPGPIVNFMRFLRLILMLEAVI